MIKTRSPDGFNNTFRSSYFLNNTIEQNITNPGIIIPRGPLDIKAKPIKRKVRYLYKLRRFDNLKKKIKKQIIEDVTKKVKAMSVTIARDRAKNSNPVTRVSAARAPDSKQNNFVPAIKTINTHPAPKRAET